MSLIDAEAANIEPLHAPAAVAYSRSYQIGLLASLILVNVINMMDRSLTGILGESIRLDLKLSDTQLGIIGGAAFVVVFSLFAVPMARIADRGLRKRVILGSIVVWCTMTTLVGFVSSFGQLIVARMGTAIGESGIVPASQALVSTQISPRRRGAALSILLFGGTLGAAAAPLIGGWVYGMLGWRGTFMVLGPCGLLLFPLVMWAVREHREVRIATASTAVAPKTTLLQTIRFLIELKSYRALWLGSALGFFATAAYLTYAGPFFIRSFGISTGEAGHYIALAFGVGSSGGVLTGGYLYDRFGKGSPGAGLRVPAITTMVAGLLGVLGWLSGSIAVTTLCFMAALFLSGLMGAAIYATALILAPAGMRATSAALFNMGLGLVGGSTGPFVTGLISDTLHPLAGTRALGYALAAAALVQFLGGTLLLRASRTIGPDLHPAPAQR
jgi:MFS family permease